MASPPPEDIGVLGMADQDSQCVQDPEASGSSDLSQVQLYWPHVVATSPYMVDTAVISSGL